MTQTSISQATAIVDELGVPADGRQRAVDMIAAGLDFAFAEGCRAEVAFKRFDELRKMVQEDQKTTPP